jgi:hypothetical protein
MSNFVVSARKYRPTTFDEVVGQDHVAKTLKNALQIAERFMGEGLNVYFVELKSEDASELGFKKITNILADIDVLTFERLMQLKMGMIWA